MSGQAQMAIPAIIHQTYPTLELPPRLRDNVQRIKALNPRFEHRLYDNDAVRAFLATEYGAGVLDRFDRIGPDYGAAKADFFRYFLIHRVGGLYLDIKSTTTVPLDELLRADDRFILSQWQNRPGESHASWGLYKEVADVPGGEYQQWFIASVPGHPFLQAVMDRVMVNIDAYSPWIHGVGKNGVLRTTGPLTYTRAIHPLIGRYPHRLIADETELGLAYTVMDSQYGHMAVFKTHYSDRHTPVVLPATATSALSARLYALLHGGTVGTLLPMLRRARHGMRAMGAR